jgi:hypothetical protein
MPALRLLFVLALLALPSVSRAKDLENFFPDLMQEIDAAFRPLIVIEGGPNPGTFELAPGDFLSGLFDGRQGVANLSEQISTQASRNPIGSTIAAFTFEFDPGLNVFTRTSEGLGPLLSERAQTTGKGKLNVAFSYAYVDFDVFEGEDLDDLDVSFNDTVPFVIEGSAAAPVEANFGTPPGAPGGPGFTSIINVQSVFPLGSRQVIPFFDAASSGGQPGSGTITNVGNTIIGIHDPFVSGFISVPSVDAVLDAKIRAQVFSLFFNYGITDKIDAGLIVPFEYIDMEGQVTTFGLLDPETGDPLPPDQGSVTVKDDDSHFGLGDITARLKANLYESKWMDAGVRGDVILPTGDEENYMGFGDPAFGLYAIFSKNTKWVSPHANGGVLLRVNDRYGHAARWSAGADFNVLERASVGFDFVGEHQLDDDGLGDNIFGVSGGAKVNVWRRLVLTGTVLFRLNDQGLRADWIPSGTIEYTFF